MRGLASYTIWSPSASILWKFIQTILIYTSLEIWKDRNLMVSDSKPLCSENISGLIVVLAKEIWIYGDLTIRVSLLPYGVLRGL